MILSTQRTSAILVAVTGWVFVLLQLYIVTSEAAEGEVFREIVQLYGYFTLLTNTIIAVIMTNAAIKVDGFANSASLRGAAALYIFLVALVFHTVLAPLLTYEGLGVYANFGLHTAVPVVYLIDWAFFAPKSSLHIKDPLKWLIFPVLYSIYSLVRGELTGWYPYFFLDPNQSSYGGVGLNILAMVALFYITGMLVYWLGKKLPWPAR